MSRSTDTHLFSSERLSRRRFVSAGLHAGVAAAAGMLVASNARAQPAAITATDLGGIKLLQGAGANLLAMQGNDGALMVDGGLAANSAALLDAVKAATGNARVSLLVNTHGHPEQVGANAAVGAAGGKILAHEKTRMYLSSRVYAMDSKRRLSPVEPLPDKARPTESVRGEGTLQFGGRRVEQHPRRGARL